MSNKILRLPAVLGQTGLSRSTIYNMVGARTFPSPVKLSSRLIGWLESDVTDWLSTRHRVGSEQ